MFALCGDGAGGGLRVFAIGFDLFGGGHGGFLLLLVVPGTGLPEEGKVGAAAGFSGGSGREAPWVEVAREPGKTRGFGCKWMEVREIWFVTV